MIEQIYEQYLDFYDVIEALCQLQWVDEKL